MENTKKKSFAIGYSYVLHAFLSFMFLAFVLVTISNLVFPDFIEKFAPDGDDPLWNTSVLSIANTACAVFASVVGIFIGQWVDKKGAKQVLIVGYFVGGAALLAFPLVPNFALFCICLALVHTSMLAFAQMTAMSLLAHWFNKKKGLALGIAAVGIPAGNAFFLIVYGALSDNFGMTVALWFFGICMIIMGILSTFWVKNTPQEVGLTPDNLPLPENTLTIEDRSYKFSEVIRTPKVWLLMINYGLLNCIVIACVAQIVSYVVEKGVPSETATTVVSFGALGGIVGGFLISMLDQKMGTKKATILYTSISIVVYFAMFLIPAGNTVLIIILCLCAFALNGAPANLLASMIITLYGPESYNSISKIATPVSCIFRSLGFYVATLLMDLMGDSWAGVYLGLGILSAVCLVLICVCKDVPSKIKTKEEVEDIFAQGETYFGFNARFQEDLGKIKELIYGRSVSGKYIEKKISEADIREIVEAGTYVPSDLNVLPWHFVAVSDDEILTNMNGMMKDDVFAFAAQIKERFPQHPEIMNDAETFAESLKNTPLVVMAFTDYPVSGSDLAEEVKQIASAIQNMLLKAYDKGIGSYWLTSPIAALLSPHLKERFSPEGSGEFICLVTFGYPDVSNEKELVKKATVEYI